MDVEFDRGMFNPFFYFEILRVMIPFQFDSLRYITGSGLENELE
jgi:hypothetical protein